MKLIKPSLRFGIKEKVLKEFTNRLKGQEEYVINPRIR